MGIGGSPGAAVTLKAGAAAVEPDTASGDLRYEAVMMNINKDNRSSGGADMIAFGEVGISGDEFVYTLYYD